MLKNKIYLLINPLLLISDEHGLWDFVPMAPRTISKNRIQEKIPKTDSKMYRCDHAFTLPTKSVLTKSDRNILDSQSGKPKKPPVNSYNLFY